MGRPLKKPRRRPVGRTPRHGARALSRHLAAGSLDGRTWIAKQLRTRCEEWAADAGGMPHLTERERTALQHTAAVSLIVDSLLNWAFGQESLLDEKNELLPPLGKSLIAYLNAERRGLELLGLRPSKPGSEPDLGEYIAARENAPRATNGMADNTDSVPGADRSADAESASAEAAE